MNFPFQQGIDAAPVFPKDRKKSLAAVVLSWQLALTGIGQVFSNLENVV